MMNCYNSFRGRLLMVAWGVGLSLVVTAAPAYAACVGAVRNGIVESGETCDDNNDVNTDGCTNNCALPACGDAITTSGSPYNETCDDGNLVATDNCTATCKIAACGDGVQKLTGSPSSSFEQCDDGNLVNSDACTGACKIAVCGDGVVRAGTEACDSGAATCTGGANPGATCTVATDCKGTCSGGPTPGAICSVTAECGVGGTCGSIGSCGAGNRNDLQDNCRSTCVNPSCGDGVTGDINDGAGADCDDGNLVNTDNCRSNCKLAACGDGVVRTSGTLPVETCDDGNLVDTDACTGACQIAVCGDAFTRAGVEQCDLGTTTNSNTTQNGCRSTCVFPSCGDGVTDNLFDGTGSNCDDGNNVNTDNCTNSCKASSCGDSIVKTSGSPASSLEQCDDGNSNNTDACLPFTCKIATCGDNAVQAGVEQCDDGKATCSGGANNGATCGVASDCKGQCDVGSPNPGALCTVATSATDCGALSACTSPGPGSCTGGDNRNDDPDNCRTNCKFPSCGDGVTDTTDGYDGMDSNCDDGNNVNTDNCTNSCKASICGDSVVKTSGSPASSFEQCDDGNSISTDACLPNVCLNALCGDGVIRAGSAEVCDSGVGMCTGGANPGSFCFSNTACKGTCSDGPFVGAVCRPETALTDCGNAALCGTFLPGVAAGVCDPTGHNSNVDNNSCRVNCLPARCGDGVTGDTADGAGANCDDGNTLTSDNCTATCKIAVCGDGITKLQGTLPLETCDDGNTDAGDGCGAACLIEGCGDHVVNGSEACDPALPAVLPTAACDIDCTLPVCNDLVVNAAAGETCDDGNNVDFDGCNMNCLLEFCGDATIQPGEECDNGTTLNSDVTPNACRENCVTAGCGDNVLDLGEDCDEGGDTATCDGEDCTFPSCGDGVFNPENAAPPAEPTGEECDDASTVDAPDVCRVNCVLPARGDGIVDPSLGEICDSGGVNTSSCTADSCPTGLDPNSYTLGIAGAICTFDALLADCDYSDCEDKRGKNRADKITQRLDKIDFRVLQIQTDILTGDLVQCSRSARRARSRAEALSKQMPKLCLSDQVEMDCVRDHIGRLINQLSGLEGNCFGDNP